MEDESTWKPTIVRELFHPGTVDLIPGAFGVIPSVDQALPPTPIVFAPNSPQEYQDTWRVQAEFSERLIGREEVM